MALLRRPGPYIGTVHAAGAAAVVQGSETGGHGRPGRSLITLVPAVIDRVPDVPVITVIETIYGDALDSIASH